MPSPGFGAAALQRYGPISVFPALRTRPACSLLSVFGGFPRRTTTQIHPRSAHSIEHTQRSLPGPGGTPPRVGLGRPDGSMGFGRRRLSIGALGKLGSQPTPPAPLEVPELAYSRPQYLSSSISLSLAAKFPYQGRVRTCTPRADPNPYHHRVGRPQLWVGRYHYRGSPRPHRRDMGRSRFSRPSRPVPRVHFPRVSPGFLGFRRVSAGLYTKRAPILVKIGPYHRAHAAFTPGTWRNPPIVGVGRPDGSMGFGRRRLSIGAFGKLGSHPTPPAPL